MKKPNTTGILFGVIAVLVIIIIALLFWRKPFTSVQTSSLISVLEQPEPQPESFTNQAMEIKSFKKETDGTYSFALDTVIRNPNFGKKDESYYMNINQSADYRIFTTTKDTEILVCDISKSAVSRIETITQQKHILVTTKNNVILKISEICVL